MSQAPREREAYQGMPSPNKFCTVIKYANIPSSVAPVAIMMMSQKFSCASGQLYFRLICRIRIVSWTSRAILGPEVVEDEEVVVEGMVGESGEGPGGGSEG